MTTTRSRSLWDAASYRRSAGAAASALLVGVSACGGGDEAAAAAPGSTSATGAATAGAGGGATAGTGAGGAGGYVPGFECVGSVMWPPLEADPLEITLVVKELVTASEVAGAAVRACAVEDPACASPTEGITDASGRVTLTLPGGTIGWRGVFEVTGPGLPTNLLAIVKPYTNDSTVAADVVSQSQQDDLAAILGVSLDPARGHLGVVARSCLFTPAAGVEIEVSLADASSTLSYFSGIVPGDGTETDAGGTVVIANVPPGMASVAARLTATGEVYGTALVPVRAGAITTFAIEPMPSP